MVTEKVTKKVTEKRVKPAKKSKSKTTPKEKKSRVGYHPWMDDNEEFHKNVASLHKHFKASSNKTKEGKGKKLQKKLPKKLQKRLESLTDLQNWTIRAEYKKIKSKEYGPYYSAFKKIRGKLYKIYLGKEVV
mgnify:CR=1 FL=1